MKRIRTINEFCKAIRLARKKHKKEKFYFSKDRINDIRATSGDKEMVARYSIRINHGITPLSPANLIWFYFFRQGLFKDTDTWGDGFHNNFFGILMRIGLSYDRAKEIGWAIEEEMGHNPVYRRKILKACGLKETPHSKRKRVVSPYQEKDTKKWERTWK